MESTVLVTVINERYAELLIRKVLVVCPNRVKVVTVGKKTEFRKRNWTEIGGVRNLGSWTLTVGPDVLRPIKIKAYWSEETTSGIGIFSSSGITGNPCLYSTILLELWLTVQIVSRCTRNLMQRSDNDIRGSEALNNTFDSSWTVVLTSWNH